MKLSLLFKISFSFFIDKKLKVAKFINILAVLAVSFGVAFFILVLSIIRGFDEKLMNEYLAIVSHISIDFSQDHDDLTANFALLEKNGFKNTSEVTDFFAVFDNKKNIQGALIRGINPEKELKNNKLKNYLNPKITNLENNEIILGKSIVESLDLKVGQKINALINKEESLIEQTFTLKSIFSFGGDLDEKIAFINNQKAKQILDIKSATAIKIMLKDPLDVKNQTYKIQNLFPFNYVSDWRLDFGHIYRDIQMLRSIIYLVSFLVLLIASFNIITSIFMNFEQKKSQVFILQTLGMNKKNIVYIFLLHGFFYAVLGNFLGIILGIILTLNISYLFDFIEIIIQRNILDPRVYFSSEIPTSLFLGDVALIGFIAFFICTLSALYPALKAKDTKISQALN